MPSKPIDISETNIANLGSDAEIQGRLVAAEAEKAWDGVGGEVGLWVWRIEQFKVVAVPRADYGKFYDGDSYIVLRTYKATPDAEKLSHNLHFWLGANTSIDEAGTAAYKTVELDDRLHRVPVQYRELQGHETAAFLACFPHFIVLQGGVASGFRHVEEATFEPRLLHVKRSVGGKGGKNVVVARQVPVSPASLNAGDVFVLETKTHIYQWNGKAASPFEKAKAATVTKALSDDRKGRAKLAVVEQATITPDLNAFYEALGGDGPIADATPDVPAAPVPTSLYAVTDAAGAAVAFKHVKTGGLSRADLKSDDAFIVDGGYQVVVWIGAHASAAEKSGAVAAAEKFLDDQKRSKLAQIVRVIEGGECSILDELLH
ncbi:hypothetical protein H9P43_004077 [Blastocladiella emersonii ATCC 22665]|nr:hypothetical protein H9P43_004077 [Blastocladiella emersonii ATCC 22665]